MRTFLLTSCSIALLAAAGASMAADPAKPADQPKSEAAKPAEPARANCMRESATRIILSKDQCSSTPGHSFTGDELRMTGEMSTAAALKKLDPALR